MARILITSAIPYINGIKHLGNLVGSQLPAAIDHAQALAPSEIVIKRGAEPTLVRQADGRIFSVPIYKVDKVIDTTGAGDSFAAGYLAARLQGQTPEVAARSGSRMASIVIQHAGAIVPNAVMPIFFFA